MCRRSQRPTPKFQFPNCNHEAHEGSAFAEATASRRSRRASFSISDRERHFTGCGVSLVPSNVGPHVQDVRARRQLGERHVDRESAVFQVVCGEATGLVRCSQHSLAFRIADRDVDGDAIDWNVSSGVQDAGDVQGLSRAKLPLGQGWHEPYGRRAAGPRTNQQPTQRQRPIAEIRHVDVGNDGADPVADTGPKSHFVPAPCRVEPILERKALMGRPS